jgi:cytochrome P450
MGSGTPPRRTGAAFFLDDPVKLDDPFPDLAWLRANEPVYHHPPLDQWFVFRHDDVDALFHDERLSADRMRGFPAAVPAEVRADVERLVPFFETWVMMTDAPEHARLRRFLHEGFNPAAVAALTTSIETATEELLDAASADGRMDACGDVAFLLPAYVLSDFLGVHPPDRGRVVDWSVDFVDFFNVLPITVESTGRMVRSAREMLDYTAGLLAERRNDPRPDFLGTLVAAEGTSGDRLTDDEVAGNAMLLLLAGHVAVRNLIGNLLWLLLTHPDQLDLLRADPFLLDGAIEEALRFEPPVTMIPRVVRADIELRGHVLRAGQIVQLNLAAANRDPDLLPDPERFDITRPRVRHTSFGLGPHRCLGSVLARAQARVVVTALLERWPRLRLDESRPVVWYRNAGNRGPEVLPLLLDP